MAVGNTFLESDGRAVDVTLTHAIDSQRVAVVEGWLGIAAQKGASGDQIALTVDQREYQWEIPTGLSVAKGDVVYVDVTDLTGHIPDDTAYSTSSGANKRPLFRATSSHYTYDSKRYVRGIMLMEA